MNTMMWSPLFLSGVAAGPFSKLSAGASPVDQTINPRSLLNPNKSAMLIDQFSFTAIATTGTPVGVGTLHSTGNILGNWCAIACEIRLGAIPLMPRPITVPVLAPRFAGGLGGVTNGEAYAPLTWHLHKPLYVPRGVQLTVRFIRQPLFATLADDKYPPTDVAIELGIRGRSLPEDYAHPSKMWVPWITEAATGPYVGTRWVSADGSGLINANAEPLVVKSLVGANVSRAYDNPAVSYLPNPCPLTVQMTASNDLAIIRDPTPFFALFPSDRGLLPFDATLQPGQFIRTEYEIASTNGLAAAYQQVEFTTVGMHGYRHIDTPKGVS